MHKKTSLLSIFLIFFTSCLPLIKGKEKLPPYHYRGYATCRETREEALRVAYLEAVRSIAEEVGVRVEAEFIQVTREKGEEIEAEVIDHIKGKTGFTLHGVKRVKENVKKNGNCYDAEVVVKISPEEIERAREEWEKYQEELLEEAKKCIEEGDRKKEEGNVIEACIHYEAARKILKDLSLAEAEAKLALVEEMLKKFNNPWVFMMELEGNGEIIEGLSLVDENDRELPSYLKIGERFKLRLTLKESTYVYVIVYDRPYKKEEKGGFRMIFPNVYSSDNLFSPGTHLFPPGDVYFEAEPPEGWNYMKVIATFVPLELPPRSSFPYYPLSPEYVNSLLLKLEDMEFDSAEEEFNIGVEE
ncbi:hypothetical protein DRQ16_03020 [bacterium]|nr:MAG: hypothetical protein DRQ16_03020 [bacterium]